MRDWSLVQLPVYSDTFAGGEYHRDMKESPELQSRFPAEGCTLSGRGVMSERQVELRRKWQDVKGMQT